MGVSLDIEDHERSPMCLGDRRMLLSCRLRRLVTILVVLGVLTFIYQGKLPRARRTISVTNSDIDFARDHHEDLDIEAGSKSHGFLPLDQAETLCRAHHWRPFKQRDTPRKIYDLFMINSELDWLEIRLNTLASQVDYFVVLESAVTFTGLEKKLVLKENWNKFKRFHSKIIYHEVENPPMEAKRTWDLEDHQRNAMFTQVLPFLEGAPAANKGDVILVSDVDEIPRPASLALLRNCEFPRRVTLRSKFYYYGFQWLHKGEEWMHPQATVYNGLNGTIHPADLRNGEGGSRIRAWWDKVDLGNAAWHCSSCFSSIEETLTKMSSFSHTSLNQELFRGRTRIVDRVRKGLDLWDRDGEVYERVDDNKDIPAFLLESTDRFKYLLNRDDPKAGFSDYGPGEDLGD